MAFLTTDIYTFTSNFIHRYRLTHVVDLCMFEINPSEPELTYLITPLLEECKV